MYKLRRGALGCGRGPSVNDRIGMGLVGPGFIAAHHIDAVRRLGFVDVVGVAGSGESSARAAAQRMGVARAYASYEELIADPAVQVVHNTTPNHMHYPVSLAALSAGKHVISDKPLAIGVVEAKALVQAARAAGVVNAVTFNYRGNPLVQEMRARVRAGEVGALQFIHGQYLQDWMTDERVYSWRSDPAKGGESSALADIGSHWCDLAQYVSGLKIVGVLADLKTVVETRYKSAGTANAFAGASEGDLEPVQVTGEDLATVLLRFEDGVMGSLRVGQVLPGHKNDLRLELNGRKGSLAWEQERQNELWCGYHDRANAVLLKDPSLLRPEARAYAHLPGGHQESWADAFRNVVADAYAWIRAGVSTSPPATVCTFAEAAHVMAVIDAMVNAEPTSLREVFEIGRG